MTRSTHLRVAELLPWYVSGTLDPAEETMAVEHLRHCAECRAVVDEELALRPLLSAETIPGVAAHPASFQRLMDQIESADGGWLRPGQFAARMAAWRDYLSASGQVQLWMLVTCQNLLLIGVVVLAMSLVGDRSTTAKREAAFRTMASSAAEGDAVLRVVFVDEVAVWEIIDLLQEHQLSIVTGPSPVGVFTIGVPEKITAAALAESLRADPRVRLVAGGR